MKVMSNFATYAILQVIHVNVRQPITFPTQCNTIHALYMYIYLDRVEVTANGKAWVDVVQPHRT